MADYETIDLEQYFDEFAEAGAMAEAQASSFKTTPAGVYRLQVMKREGRKAKAGFPVAHLTIAIYSEDGSKRLGTTFTDVVWKKYTDSDGNIVREFQRWEQLTRALYPDKSADERNTIPMGEVLADAEKYPVKGYVTERFLIPDGSGGGKWTPTRTTDEADSYRKAGYKALNGVANFSRF